MLLGALAQPDASTVPMEISFFQKCMQSPRDLTRPVKGAIGLAD